MKNKPNKPSFRIGDRVHAIADEGGTIEITGEVTGRATLKRYGKVLKILVIKTENNQYGIDIRRAKITKVKRA